MSYIFRIHYKKTVLISLRRPGGGGWRGGVQGVRSMCEQKKRVKGKKHYCRMRNVWQKIFFLLIYPEFRGNYPNFVRKHGKKEQISTCECD